MGATDVAGPGAAPAGSQPSTAPVDGHRPAALRPRAPDTPPWLVAGVASVAAALVHAVAVAGHAEQRTALVAFTATALLQAGVGIAVLRRPDHLTASVLYVVNAAIVGAWVLSATVGLPELAPIPHVDTPGLLAAQLGLLAVAAAACCRRRLPAPGWMAVVVGAGVLVLGAAGMVTAATDDHGHGGGHDHECSGGGELVGDRWECVTGPARVVSDHPFDQEPTGEQRDAAARFAAQAEEYARRYEDVDDARADGYDFFDWIERLRFAEGTPEEPQIRSALREGTVVHAISEELSNDDVSLDPTRPDSLMYAVRGDEWRLVGVMFFAAPGEHGPQIGGPLTTWHVHGAETGVCWDGSAPVGFGGPRVGDDPDAAGVPCSRGEVAERTPEMFHVWFGRSSLAETFHSAMTDEEAAALLADRPWPPVPVAVVLAASVGGWWWSRPRGGARGVGLRAGSAASVDT